MGTADEPGDPDVEERSRRRDIGPIHEVLPGLLTGAPDALLAVDGDGRIVFVSDQAERLFEWSRDDLVGQQVECLIPERSQSRHPALRHDYAENPMTRPMGAGLDIHGRRRDGSEFAAEIKLSTFSTARGPMVAVAVHDVTSIRRSEHQLRAVLALVPDAILGVDTAGRIALMNTRAEELFGWPADELVGQPVEVLVPDASFDAHERLRLGFITDKVARMDARRGLSGKRRDGTTFPAEISISSLYEQDQELILAAVRDVTDRVASEQLGRREMLEAQRDQAHRLESLGQLAGGVAHDFNNLLGVILNYSTLLARQLEDKGALADVGQITAAAERAAALTRQLLAFARRDVAYREPIDVNEVITGFSSLLERTLGVNIVLRLELWPQPLVVIADRHQLEQVLLNLALNGNDAMKAGGHLTIATSLAPPDHSPTHVVTPHSVEHVVVEVRDTGVGMTPEVLDRALEPFFTTKPPGDGTGLGLATVYGIVTQNSGRIEIDSSPGGGTTVRFCLDQADEEAIRREQSDTPVGGSERLLLVEDETSLRFVTQRILAEHGYDVVTASNGVEALEVFDRLDGAVDLVVTDVEMPVMRGDELAVLLREREPSLRLLLMSGYTWGDIEPPGRLLEKPVSEATLLRAIRDVLDA